MRQHDERDVWLSMKSFEWELEDLNSKKRTLKVDPNPEKFKRHNHELISVNS
jgi:hypothetical protein